MVRTRPSQSRNLDGRRQHCDERGWPALCEIWRYSRIGSWPQDRTCRREATLAWPPHSQGRYRTRSHRTNDWLGRHPRRDCRSDSQVAPLSCRRDTDNRRIFCERRGCRARGICHLLIRRPPSHNGTYRRRRDAMHRGVPSPSEPGRFIPSRANRRAGRCAGSRSGTGNHSLPWRGCRTHARRRRS